MQHIDSAYILAGGRSRRFGKNKALVEIEGVPLVVRLTQQMQESGLSVKMVSQSERDYAGLGIPTITDGLDNAGPLAGFRAALRDSRATGKVWSLIVSCDLIEWRYEWLENLQATLKQKLSLQVDKVQTTQIVVFAGEPFRPFPGLYRNDLCDVAEGLLNDGVPSLKGLFRCAEGRIENCPIPNAPPRSFNTEAEFQQLMGKPS